MADGGVQALESPTVAPGSMEMGLATSQSATRSGWEGIELYRDRDRYRVAFGATTMPIDRLRCWEVAGESHRQDVIASIIAAPKSPDGCWVERAAVLRPEPDNQFDPNAVAVDIDGQQVGYLPRATAGAARRRIDQIVSAHGRATCGAVINGGWIRGGGDEGHYGVWLYFGLGAKSPTGPDALPPPLPGERRIPYVVADNHDHIAVTGEEYHQDNLVASLGDEWIGDNPFRLVEIAAGRDRKNRPTAVVLLDEQRVGCLTPKMTERFASDIAAAAADGVRLTAAATLEQSKRKGCESQVDIVLRVPEGWGRVRAANEGAQPPPPGHLNGGEDDNG